VCQGQVDAHRWYLVADGELEVEVERFVVGELHPGSQFGERALLRGLPRAATVRAVTDVLLFALDREDFLASVAGMDLDAEVSAGPGWHATRLDPSAALAQAPLVHNLAPARLVELCQSGRVHEVPGSTAVVTRGERDDTYHVVLSGRADVVVDGTVVTLLLPGDAFGEIAVLHRIPRAEPAGPAPCIVNRRSLQCESRFTTPDEGGRRGHDRSHRPGSRSAQPGAAAAAD
jgi:CRP-like cAMP-binding protein